MYFFILIFSLGAPDILVLQTEPFLAVNGLWENISFCYDDEISESLKQKLKILDCGLEVIFNIFKGRPFSLGLIGIVMFGTNFNLVTRVGLP